MTRADLLRKIRGLLEISRRSPFEAEAQTAMAAAQRMLLAEGLSLDDVAQAGSVYGTDDLDAVARRRPETLAVATIVQDFFFVRVVFVQVRNGADRPGEIVRFFGEESHRAIARFVWTYLSRTFRALWNARRAMYGRFAGSPRWFFDGLMVGVSERLERERKTDAVVAQQAGLIHLKNVELQKAYQIAFPKVSPIRERGQRISEEDFAAYQHGRERGASIGIPLAIGATGNDSVAGLLEVVR